MISNNIRIFSLLVWRELAGMRETFIDMLINGCLMASTEALVYGYFMPQFGMSKEIVPLMYAGAVLMFFTNIGNERLFRDAFDLAGKRFVDYQLILPVSRFWLFASFLASYMIDLTCKAIFPLFLGFLIINKVLLFSKIHVIPLFCMHIMSVMFCSLFFMVLTYAWDHEWLVGHLWPRFLVPLLTFSSSWYPWYYVNSATPWWGKVFLLNPFTYIVEGFRVALLNSAQAIPIEYCVIVLGLSCVILIGLLSRVVKTRLDLV